MTEPCSDCCSAPLKVGGAGTTHWWVCTACNMSCNAVPQVKRTGMAGLSPAARAVRDAAEERTDLDFRYAPMIAAAALRAAVDQVVPENHKVYKHFTNEAIRLNRMSVRADLLAIAAELEQLDD